jgi:hypothetical protein
MGFLRKTINYGANDESSCNRQTEKAFLVDGKYLEANYCPVKGDRREKKKVGGFFKFFRIPERKENAQREQPKENSTSCYEKRFAYPEIVSNNFTSRCFAKTCTVDFQVRFKR